MEIAGTEIPGVYTLTPDLITDHRGAFFESLRAEELSRFLGRPFAPAQINFSSSRRNTLRGLHSVTLPPGQAKYVTCVRGALRDISVDLRVGSPSFGRHTVRTLDAESGVSVFIPEGVAHGFLTLADDTCISYVLSTAHVPGTQIDIDPLDPELSLPWGLTEEPVMSEKDARAMSVRQALSAGVLAHWSDVCP
ncbi:dTDP-4-dehydrorhamnose 3,5-epimerase family protein [Streptomyces sp. Je 1-79]|uniref:dTDP-4-dehydrorhamnose 3,5-epimerase family protein n=1 Tax=Streptomyces sp. Je 1-79 TaxID=2943847 RepID=UPI0021A3B707|nr:dTDP-4-dehydrorhamnose 3,5-epimerase family protein [Streptomyces sp. Je 1-79]MCT4356207.1 dTDP-4-dehydrorhamnose 3,5-epimerase family protein [Streptomyces sp. Je 1-79]